MQFLKNFALANKRILSITGFIFLHSINVSSMSVETLYPLNHGITQFWNPMEKEKPKIIIMSSRGGGGHIAVASALQEYLEPHADIKVTYVFDEVLGNVDATRFFLKQKGEDFYNYCMQRKWFSVLNLFHTMGSWYFWLRQGTTEDFLYDFIAQENPDLVISVIPLINGHILNVTEELDIPFLMIPTDLDTRTFMAGIDSPTYEKFHLALPFDIQESVETAFPEYVEEKHYSITGFPIKQSFFKQWNSSKTYRDFAIQKDKPVIMLLMGAMGADSLIRFSKALTKIDEPAHVVVCVGKNEAARKKIKELKLPSHISMSIVGFTNRIAELMSVADILVTKSGSASVCEGLYMQVPMLLDATTTVLRWERLNHEIIEQYGLGVSIESTKHLVRVVNDLLKHPEKLAEMKNNFATIEKKEGGNQILQVVQSMIAS